jgi:uncharacterized protein (UPF0212 family)
MNCRVTLEAAVPVYDVDTPDEAIRIGISKVGKQLNPDLNYVEIEPGERTSPDGEPLEPAFIVAGEALVALDLQMDVFSVEGEEHATRIARKEIGQRLENVPLEVIDIAEITEEGDPVDAADAAETPADAPEAPDSHSTDDDAAGSAQDAGAAEHEGREVDEDDELLPEFEEMV